MDNSNGLEKIFNPRAVAIVGATDNPSKQGNWCVQSLMDMGYPGKIFLINQNRKDILGVKAHGSLAEIREQIRTLMISREEARNEVDACSSCCFHFVHLCRFCIC